MGPIFLLLQTRRVGATFDGVLVGTLVCTNATLSVTSDEPERTVESTTPVHTLTFKG